MKQFTALLVTILSSWEVFAQGVPSCDSKIYCQGDLLNTVQYTHKLFKDSKDFVDRSQVNSPDVTLANFNALMKQTNNKPTNAQLETFVKENFRAEGELEDWIPSDFKKNPAFLNRITTRRYRALAKNMVEMWPKLARKVKKEVEEQQDKHSLLYVPNGFIIPGGRFKEIYYWDSYWIIKGLLISEMHVTVKGMLENFLSLVKKHGFVPNGSRVYYLNRSQPPLLAMMAGLYIDASKDIAWLKENIGLLEKELNWWLDHRIVDVKKGGTTYKLARYAVDSGTPRPESYSEDIQTCKQFEAAAKETCYKNLKSGAESGWDFSTRWIFDPSKENGTDISYLDVFRVIPVDLNSFLCKAFQEITRFYILLGNIKEGAVWWEKANTWQKSIEEVLYDKEDGIWYDYDVTNSRSNKRFYPSNFAPLWADCFNVLYSKEIGTKAAKYFKKSLNTDYYNGGIPTSIYQSGEQWDLPNAWPPLQEIVILGLYKTNSDEAKDIAKTYATRWLHANDIGYETDNAMYEKYDAVEPGKYGGGGEYEVQAGFGWTNGVVLSFIAEFELYSSSRRPGGSTTSGSPKSLSFISLTNVLLVVGISLFPVHTLIFRII